MVREVVNIKCFCLRGDRRSNPDLVQENPGQSDAFDRWTKIGVEQGDDLHHDGTHGLSLVVVVVVHHALLE